MARRCCHQYIVGRRAEAQNFLLPLKGRRGKKFFRMEGSDLEFTHGALAKIAERAVTASSAFSCCRSP
jgi:hypothetical protein